MKFHRQDSRSQGQTQKEQDDQHRDFEGGDGVTCHVLFLLVAFSLIRDKKMKKNQVWFVITITWNILLSLYAMDFVGKNDGFPFLHFCILHDA
jgi:hypothetical protein